MGDAIMPLDITTLHHLHEALRSTEYQSDPVGCLKPHVVGDHRPDTVRPPVTLFGRISPLMIFSLILNF